MTFGGTYITGSPSALCVGSGFRGHLVEEDLVEEAAEILLEKINTGCYQLCSSLWTSRFL